MITASPPPKDYLELTEKIREELALVVEGKKKSFRELTLMRSEAAEYFRSHFGLQPTSADCIYEAAAKIGEVTGNLWTVDHASYLKLPPAVWVIVTQPFCAPDWGTARFGQILQLHAVDLVDCNKWSWYYPGRSVCYAMVMTRFSFRLLRQERLTGGEAQYIFGSPKKCEP